MNEKLKFILMFAVMPFAVSFIVASIVVWVQWKPVREIEPSNLFENVPSIQCPVDWNAVFAGCKNYDMDYIMFTLCKNDADRLRFLEAVNKQMEE